MIKLQNVSFRYNKDKFSLKSINLEINKGEFVAIVGRNGCGKSTLAKHLNAILTPTDGLVMIDDLSVFDPKSIWEIRKKVGLIFQNTDNQIIASIVEEDVAFGLENLNLPYDEILAKTNYYIKLMGIQKYRKTPIEELSGGQKQKVLLAGVLAMQPEYLILDEPGSMLDSLSRENLIQNLIQINKNSKTTIVLITHFMEDIINCDRVVVMDSAKIVWQSSPKELFLEDEPIESYNLKLPFILEVAKKLRQRGLKIDKNLFTCKELVEILCKLK